MMYYTYYVYHVMEATDHVTFNHKSTCFQQPSNPFSAAVPKTGFTEPKKQDPLDTRVARVGGLKVASLKSALM